MEFKIFKKYYDLAEKQSSLNDYLTASSKLNNKLSKNILTNIYHLANSPIKELSVMSVREMSTLYSIPERTLFAWNSGERTPPKYVKLLISYTLLSMNIKDRN